jgi:3-deoxy-D-manno-octulosonic-acid transferase
MVSARLSERSVRRFSAFPLHTIFWKPLFRTVSAVGAQSVADANRFSRLGFRDVRTTGNLKFDITLPTVESNTVREAWHLAPDDFVVVVGSSRPGEEEIIRHAVMAPGLTHVKWVIVPRHLNRLDEVQSIFSATGWRSPEQSGDARVIIVDRMGVLTTVYAMADLAIVGGSLCDFGGHNPLEPAFYGIPTLMGPFHRSCRDSVAALKTTGGIRIVEAADFTKTVEELVASPEARAKMGNAARQTLTRNHGAVQRTLNMLTPYL